MLASGRAQNEISVLGMEFYFFELQTETTTTQKYAALRFPVRPFSKQNKEDM